MATFSGARLLATADSIRTGEPQFFTSRAERTDRYPHLAAEWADVADEAWVIAPLVTEGRALGAMGLTWRAERVFSPADQGFILTLTQQCILALERSRLYEAEQVAHQRAEALAAEQTAILRQIADGVILADSDGRIVFVNEAARTLCGLPADISLPAEPETILTLTTADGQRLAPRNLPQTRAIRCGETFLNVEPRVERPDGSAVSAEANAAPVISEDGVPIGAVLTLHDVTMQRELRRQQEEFFANASHDLRTPLSAIKTAISTILAHEDPGISVPIHRLFLAIDRSADRMEHLVTDLLELTRLEVGHSPLQLVEIDLREIADRAARAIEPLTTTRAQKLVLELPEWPVTVLVDPDRLGLPIVCALVELHGGRVWVESELGAGATFWVALPATGMTTNTQR